LGENKNETTIMTEKEIAHIKVKLKWIWEVLSKKIELGDYATSLGFRYYPTKHYIKLGEFFDGLTYLYWFEENFLNDSYNPNFLFEWTIILYKTGNIREAEKKAFVTFCSNIYLFDKFFQRLVVPIETDENSNLASSYDFQYSSDQSELADFTNWLNEYTSTEKFITLSTKFIELNTRLETERDEETRGYLLLCSQQLVSKI
jgi:hypothetical protein